MSGRGRRRNKRRRSRRKSQHNSQRKIWIDDEDVQIQRQIARRETRPVGLPAEGDVVAMGRLVTRLVHASVLVQDVIDTGTDPEAPLRPAGLAYAANALNRDAVRLYRLYYGCPPDEI